ncbi:MAG: efflux RND transporter periplasmic adaptor subunit [Bacteroidales bacterium]|nr:efflux RND transporter periplasmic adaptor subunit [Bacteroidales bacterium]MDD3664435.1 efflux RND transporter periplasmic adaptor subunit [Bacteroidales bacterium]
MDRIIEKKRWTPRKIGYIAAGVLFLAFVAWLAFFRDNRSRLYIDKNQITIAEVKLDKFQEFIPIDGVVHPRTTVYIDAMQGGVVEKIFVEDGALLQKGEPILKLHNPTMELSYMDQETRMYDAINNLQNSKIALEQNKFVRQKEIVQLQYQLEGVERDYQRKVSFHQEKLISDKEFEDATREYKNTRKQLTISIQLMKLDSVSTIDQKRQIENSITRMSNNLGMLQQNMENMTIKAPADGKLSSFSVEIGETKSAGEHLGQIDIQDGFKLRANIDERYVSKVFVGQPAEFDFTGTTFSLSISKIYTNVTNGSFQVDLAFDSAAPAQIKRGQTVQLRLKFSSAADAVIVKRGGFFQETGGNWIYVVDQSGSYAVKRPIRIGRQNTNYYEVMEGLEPGEKVIVSSYETFGKKEKLIFN